MVQGHVVEGVAPADLLQPPVPQHAPGSMARMEDLDVRVATGQSLDPLAGGRTMIAADKVLLAWHSTDTAVPFCSKPYDIPADLTAPVAKTKACDIWGTQQIGNNLAVASGHLLSPSPNIDALLVTDFETNRLVASIRRYNSSLGQY